MQARTNTLITWDFKGFSRPLMYTSNRYLLSHYHVPGHNGENNTHCPDFHGAYYIANHANKYVMEN